MSMMGVSSLLLSLDNTELYRIILDNNMDVMMAGAVGTGLMLPINQTFNV